MLVNSLQTACSTKNFKIFNHKTKNFIYLTKSFTKINPDKTKDSREIALHKDVPSEIDSKKYSLKGRLRKKYKTKKSQTRVSKLHTILSIQTQTLSISAYHFFVKAHEIFAQFRIKSGDFLRYSQWIFGIGFFQLFQISQVQFADIN